MVTCQGGKSHWNLVLLHSVHNPKEKLSIQAQAFGPLSQLLLRQGAVSATENTRDDTCLWRCLQSPVREELFHFLGDWQCQHLVGGEEAPEGFPA